MGKKRSKKDGGSKTDIAPLLPSPIPVATQEIYNPVLDPLLIKKLQTLGIGTPSYIPANRPATELTTLGGMNNSCDNKNLPVVSNSSTAEICHHELDGQVTKKLESLGLALPISQATTVGSIFNCEKLDQDEYINNDEDDDEVMYVVEQREIFQPYVCHVCKVVRSDEGTPLRRCNSCKMISYCSREHQKSHWPKHKQLCRAICRVSKRDGLDYLYDNTLGLSAAKYRQYRMSRISDCTTELGRALELWEREMFYHVPTCQTCHQSDKSKLITCSKCLHVHYCTPQHLHETHSQWCPSFSLYRDILIYQSEHGMIQPWLPNKVFTDYEPLTGTMREFLLGAFGSAALMQWNKLTYAVATDVATCPLTILFALQACHLTPSLALRTTLTIHMVGSELHFEADTVNKYEIFLLHLLPKLRALRIVFVGPELQERPQHSLGNDKVCFSCRHAGKQLKTEYHTRTFYHDYVKLASYTRPDLICAFNAGLYRSTGYAGSDTWPASISVMLRDRTVPVVVTAYTAHELPLDVQRMREHCPAKLQVLMDVTENPFSSSKPSLNFINEEATPLIFKNFFIVIANGIE